MINITELKHYTSITKPKHPATSRFLAAGFMLLCSALMPLNSAAQRADSLIVADLRREGITFTHDNSVTLLMSGQEKFDDMFQAIRDARAMRANPSIWNTSTSATTPLPTPSSSCWPRR